MNKTQLKQGSLNGLRRQTNECLDNAYNKGYQDGKLDFEESNGQAEYNNGYKQGIADYRKFEKFYNSDGIAMFDDIRNTDGTLSLDMILQYLPMREIMTRIKVYEEKKKAEEEIKVGDIVFHKDHKIKGVVYKVEDGFAYGTNGFLNSFEWGTNLCTKVGHIDELETLVERLRGENNV